MKSSAAANRPLHRLVYRSRITPATAANLDHELRSILASAIANNRRDAISGLLIVVQDSFVQALEGSADKVLHTFGAISRDPRHTEAAVISAGPVEARLFSDWNMCARILAPSDRAIIDVIDARGAFDPAKLTAAAGLRLLLAVADIQRRTALSALVA